MFTNKSALLVLIAIGLSNVSYAHAAKECQILLDNIQAEPSYELNHIASKLGKMTKGSQEIIKVNDLYTPEVLPKASVVNNENGVSLLTAETRIDENQNRYLEIQSQKGEAKEKKVIDISDTKFGEQNFSSDLYPFVLGNRTFIIAADKLTAAQQLEIANPYNKVHGFTNKAVVEVTQSRINGRVSLGDRLQFGSQPDMNQDISSRGLWVSKLDPHLESKNLKLAGKFYIYETVQQMAQDRPVTKLFVRTGLLHLNGQIKISNVQKSAMNVTNNFTRLMMADANKGIVTYLTNEQDGTAKVMISKVRLDNVSIEATPRASNTLKIGPSGKFQEVELDIEGKVLHTLMSLRNKKTGKQTVLVLAYHKGSNLPSYIELIPDPITGHVSTRAVAVGELPLVMMDHEVRDTANAVNLNSSSLATVIRSIDIDMDGKKFDTYKIFKYKKMGPSDLVGLIETHDQSGQVYFWQFDISDKAGEIRAWKKTASEVRELQRLTDLVEQTTLSENPSF